MAWFKRNPRAILTPQKSGPTVGIMRGLNRDRYTKTGDYAPQPGIVGPPAAEPEAPSDWDGSWNSPTPEDPGPEWNSPEDNSMPENCEWVCSGPESPGGGSINDKRAPSIGRKAPKPYKLKPLKGR